MKNKIKIILELTKIRITLFVMLTTTLGYVSAAGEINSGLILPSIGILLIACGSAALNHYQERKTDALMERTKNRPLPSGKISPRDTLILIVILISLGSLILLYSSGFLALGLALLNIIWYNVIYTPLKKKNAAAIVPGSLVGAIPPAVGWIAAGGSIFEPQIIIISFFFFIWQIPHFWLLLLVLSNDYEQAGFPTLTKTFSREQLARITFIWIAATAVTSFLIPLFGIVQNNFMSFGFFIAGIWLVWHSVKLLRHNIEKSFFRFAFKDINIFALAVVVILSVDKLIIF